MFKWLCGPMLYSKVDRLGTYAAALAYCFVLSLIPFLVMTFAVGMKITAELALKNDAYSSGYSQALRDVLPVEKPEDVTHILDVVQNAAGNKKSASFTRSVLVATGFLLAAYTSYNLMAQIVHTLHFIFDDDRRPRQWTWAGALKTVTLLLLWMCLLLLISVTAAEATGLRELLQHSQFSGLGDKLVNGLQVLLVVSALFGTFYLTYYLVPSRSFKKRYLMEGSLLASSGWIVCSLIFASVVPQLLQTSAAYIALGSVVAILLWAQACAWSIIAGACWIVRFSPRGK